MIWLQFALVTLAPVALLWVYFNLSLIVDAITSAWRWLRRRKTPDVAPFPVQKIAADLHRLNAYLEQLEQSDAPARAARLKAAVLAYDDVLLLACRTLEIPAPECTPMAPIARLETEAALAQRGLVW